MRIKIPLLIAGLASLLLLSGCATLATSTPWPTRTPRPTKTATPTTVPTTTLTPTATTVPVTRAGTPLPVAGLPIDRAHAAGLKPVARWGQGIPQALDFSPTGDLVAVASTRGLYLYDAADLSPTLAVEPGYGLRCLAFSPDGALIAAGADDGKIRLFQATDGALAQTLTGHSGPVFSLAFSHDGALLATGGWDNTIRLWNAATGEYLRQLSGNLAPARRLAFSPEDDRLFAWSPTDQLLAWEVSGRALEPVYVGVDNFKHSGSSAGFTPGGDFFVVDQDTRAKVFFTESGNTLSQINLTGPLLRVAVSGGGELVAGATASALSIWQGQGGARVREFPSPGGAGAFAFLAFSPDGTRLATAGDALRLWSLDGDGPEPAAAAPAAFQMGFRLGSAFSPDGEALTHLLMDGSLQPVRLSDGASLPAAGVPSGPANALALSPGGDLAATAAADNKVMLWRVEGGALLYTLKGHTRMPLSLAFSPDGALLASGSSDGVVFVWETATGAQVAALEAPGGAERVAFSPDGERLAAAAPEEVLFWRVSGWTRDGALPGRGPVFSPDGGLLALVDNLGEQASVRLYEAGADRPARSLPVTGSSLAFSPDGSLLAVSGSGISLWSTSDGEQLAALEIPVSHGQVAFSPDGRLLLLTTWDSVVYLWAVPD